ncbi:MAG TPA: hypothetical protein VL358_13775 [Caulobacteraceae bacterium]|jgi:hypothetical protein|nr:hypothetical protein [Caulobacteraceae bacterium]
MGEFSVTEAGLAGFKFIRNHPGIIACWVGFQLIYQVAEAGFGVLLAGGRGGVSAGSVSAGLDHGLGVLTGDIREQIPALVLLPLSAVLWTAAVRAYARPLESRFAYLRLGTDELRMFRLAILITIVEYFALLLGGIAFGALLLIAVSKNLPHPVEIILGGMFLVAVVIVSRLILAPAATFDQRRVVLLQSWKLTRGRFWPLAGLTLFTAIVFFGLRLPISLLQRVGFEGGWMPPRSFADMFMPLTMLRFFYNSIFSTGFIVVWAGIASVAYFRLNPSEAAKT